MSYILPTYNIHANVDCIDLIEGSETERGRARREKQEKNIHRV